MNDLKGQPAELRATVTIKRKATGKVETYELTGAATPEQAKALGASIVSDKQPKEHGNVSQS